MSELSAAVAELTSTHSRQVGELSGPEPALFDLLQQAITTGTISKGLQAQHLWNEIALVVAFHWPYAGLLQHASTPLPARLQEWARVGDGSANGDLLTGLCTGWAIRIRELLGPTAVMPVEGVPCTACGATHWRTGYDGTPVFITAVVLNQEALAAGCRCCGTSWTGDELLQLGALAVV